MPISSDGYCHTTIDTTMYYTSNDTRYAVIIFATYEYQGEERASCHACAPTLSIACFAYGGIGVWEIQHFKKDFVSFGCWGKKLGKINIEKLGFDFYALKMQSAVELHQGYEKGITSYYSLDRYNNLKEIFSFVYHESNVGAMQEGRGFAEETTIKTVPTDDYHMIELFSKRTDRKIYTKKRFIYSEDDLCYKQAN